MSDISAKEIARLSRMTPGALEVEFGRAYGSTLRPRLSREPLSDVDASRKDVLGLFALQGIKGAEGLDFGKLNQAQAKVLFKLVWRKSVKRLRREICVKFDYCKKRSQYKDETNTAIAVGGVVSSALSLPIGISFILALYLTKKGLDKFCKCGTRGLKVGTVGP